MQLKGEIIFDIRAKVKKQIDEKYYVLYQGNNITPIGLKVGHLGLFGWYFSAFTNNNFNLNDYELKNELIQDYPANQYYIFKDEKKYLRYSVVAGINYQFLRNLYINFGIGYGHKELIKSIDEFSYNNDTFIQENYVKIMPDSYSGLEFETGLMCRWNNIIISGGLNSLNFRRLDWNFGVGYCF